MSAIEYVNKLFPESAEKLSIFSLELSGVLFQKTLESLLNYKGAHTHPGHLYTTAALSILTVLKTLLQVLEEQDKGAAMIAKAKIREQIDQW